MKERKSRSQRLPLPKSCPEGGIWLCDQKFYYRPSSAFAGSLASGQSEFEVGRSSHFLPPLSQSPHAALCVEFCSGNGSWIEQRASLAPDCHWIAVEHRLDRAHKIWLRQQKSGLSNLTVACAEASFFCRLQLPIKSVEQCFINFPDPWPKARHAKHRLLKVPFLRQLSSVLIPSGHLFISTDDIESLNRLQVALDEEGSFHYQLHRFSPDQPFEQYGTSYFETLWRSKGKSIHLVHCRLKSQNQNLSNAMSN